VPFNRKHANLSGLHTFCTLYTIGPWLSIENHGDLGPFLQKKPHETSDTLGFLIPRYGPYGESRFFQPDGPLLSTERAMIKQNFGIIMYNIGFMWVITNESNIYNL